MPLAWTIMAVLGVAMVAIFLHIRFVLYRRLGRAVVASEWTAGGAALAQIRRRVSINLGLVILVLLVTLMRRGRPESGPAGRQPANVGKRKT